jgi:hypothetical protein
MFTLLGSGWLFPDKPIVGWVFAFRLEFLKLTDHIRIGFRETPSAGSSLDLAAILFKVRRISGNSLEEREEGKTRGGTIGGREEGEADEMGKTWNTALNSIQFNSGEFNSRTRTRHTHTRGFPD